MPRLAAMVACAICSAWRPPNANASRTPTIGATIASTSKEPPAVVIGSRAAGAASADAGLGARAGRGVVAQGGRAGGLVQAQPERGRQRRGGERDDDAGDDQRLPDRIAAEPRRGASAGDDAEQQEQAPAEQVQ